MRAAGAPVTSGTMVAGHGNATASARRQAGASQRGASQRGARPAAMAQSAQTAEQIRAFERIYDEFKTPIYNHIYHMVGNRDEASELTHDTFMKAFKALPRMDANLKLSAWLYRIAANTAKDALRRRKLITWLPWQGLDHEPADVESADPQKTVGTAEMVRAALLRMPPQYREALLLYQDGFTYAEIAATLHIAESGVKMYLSRARHSFREIYRALEQGGGT